MDLVFHNLFFVNTSFYIFLNTNNSNILQYQGPILCVQHTPNETDSDVTFSR